MSVFLWVLKGIAAWLGLALPVGIGIGRMARLRDQAPAVEPDPRDGWTDEAVRAEFEAMMPGFVTDLMPELDKQIDRRARRWTK